MRPKTTKADVPTTHDIMSHLHNEFVGWLQELKADIEVLGQSPQRWDGSLTPRTFQAAPGLISTTADGWSVDTTKASFLGVTAHWIEVKNGKWKLRAEVIGFRGISGEHSGANLGRYFLGVCERVGIVNAQRSKVTRFDVTNDNLIHMVNSFTLSRSTTHQTTQQHARQSRHFTADESFNGTARKTNSRMSFSSAVDKAVGLYILYP
jgi:hypothetical protein